MKIETIEDDVPPSFLTFYPFAYALLDGDLNDFCWYCLSSPMSSALKRCAACKCGLFCGKACQEMGWTDHKAECKGFVRLNKCEQKEKIPDVEVRLLGRIVYRHKQILEGVDKKTVGFYTNRQSERSIVEIWSHAEDMRKDPKAMKTFLRLSDGLRKFYPQNCLLDDETIFQLHCRNYINRHAINDPGYLREIGKGLYLDLCAYDHSCAPNTIYITQGFIATLKPLVKTIDIRDKTKAYYSYIDLLATKIERKNMLRESWYFDCECERCRDPHEHLLTSLKCQNCSSPNTIFDDEGFKKSTFSCISCGSGIPDDQISRAIECMKQINRSLDEMDDDLNSRSLALQKCKEILENTKNEIPGVNYYFAKVLQQAIRCTDPSDYEALLSLHSQATACLKLCYPKYHPALAYHHLNMGIFQFNLKKVVEAKDSLLKALGSLRYVLGKRQPMTLKAEEFLSQCGSDFCTD